jgi:formylglycine-generating enzyme required for sulfatase activity
MTMKEIIDPLIRVIPHVGSFWSLSAATVVIFGILLVKLMKLPVTKRHTTMVITVIASVTVLVLTFAFTAQALELTRVPRDTQIVAKIEELKTDVLKQLSVATNMIDLTGTIKRWNRFTLANPDDALLHWATEQLSASDSDAAIGRFFIDHISNQRPDNEKRVKVNGMMLIELPAGSFVMGSDNEPGSEPDETPSTKVSIGYSFWIGKFEVTQAEYESVRAAGESDLDENPSVFNMHRPGGDGRNPVDNITWIQAMEFCRTITKKELLRIPVGYEFRLPTEAEWEYACRAGNAGLFTYGDSVQDLSKYAWFQANSQKATHVVGSKLPNRWGIYDMHGNVMEWCLDWYSNRLFSGSVSNPVQLAETGKRSIRGGSWNSEKVAYLRSADRHALPPSEKGWAYGFRVVLAPKIAILKTQLQK